MIKRQLELVKALCDRLYYDGQGVAKCGLVGFVESIASGETKTTDEELLHRIDLLRQELDTLERMVRGE